MEKWERREAKLTKRKSAMKVSGRSVFLLQSLAARPLNPKKAKASQPHDHPQPGLLDRHGNCPGCVTYDKENLS